MNNSLSFRLTLRIFLLTFALLLGAWAVFYFSLSRSFASQDKQELRERVATLQELLKEEPEDSRRLIIRVEKEWAARTFEHIYASVKTTDGREIAATPGMVAEQKSLFDQLEKKLNNSHESGLLERAEVLGQVYWVGAKAMDLNGRNILIFIAMERTSEDETLRRLGQFAIYLVIFGGLASLWIGRAAVKFALEQVLAFSNKVRGIESSTLQDRIDPESLPVEFREMAVAFNEMLSRVQAGFERLSRFSADMAHELRTPVHALMGSFGVALSKPRSADEYQALLSSGVEECERLKRIIEALLFIARSSDPSEEVKKEVVDLKFELEEVISFYEVLAEEEGIKIELKAEKFPPIAVEITLFHRAVGNLLSNAIRYSPADGGIEISVQESGNRVIVEVQDQGPGIPHEALANIGDRFFRVEASRSKSSGGHGLGLSIVKGIMAVHEGALSIHSAPGNGTKVSLSFPATGIGPA